MHHSHAQRCAASLPRRVPDPVVVCVLAHLAGPTSRCTLNWFDAIALPGSGEASGIRFMDTSGKPNPNIALTAAAGAFGPSSCLLAACQQ